MFDLKIKEIIAEQLGIDISEVDDEADIVDDLGAGSLDIVEMTIAVEETFGVTISDADIIDNRTVGDVCAYIRTLT